MRQMRRWQIGVARALSHKLGWPESEMDIKRGPMRQLSFKRRRFPADIIRHSIWLYARFTRSYRDVEEMLAERGLNISYETVRRWFLKCHLGNVS